MHQNPDQENCEGVATEFAPKQPPTVVLIGLVATTMFAVYMHFHPSSPASIAVLDFLRVDAKPIHAWYWFLVVAHSAEIGIAIRVMKHVHGWRGWRLSLWTAGVGLTGVWLLMPLLAADREVLASKGASRKTAQRAFTPKTPPLLKCFATLAAGGLCSALFFFSEYLHIIPLVDGASAPYNWLVYAAFSGLVALHSFETATGVWVAASHGMPMAKLVAWSMGMLICGFPFLDCILDEAPRLAVTQPALSIAHKVD